MKKHPSRTPALQAKANSSFFGKRGKEGHYQEQSSCDQFFPAAQKGGSQVIRRKPETNDKGDFTGNYIFNPGHDGLNRGFFLRVKKAVADGVLDDAEIGALRKDAIDRNGTVMHAELLLMAAMRNPANVSLMQAYTHGSLKISMSQVRKADEDYLANFGREAVPEDIVALNWRSVGAKLGITGEDPASIDQEIDRTVANQIEKYAGLQFADQAGELIVDAWDDPQVPLTDILVAMLNGASDSTPGDRVMAGIVYCVARKAGSPMAVEIATGRLKVDALVPSVFARVVGPGGGAYQPFAGEDVLKGDTIYLPTSISLLSLLGRSVIIHELKHAQDDFSVKGNGMADNQVVEGRAYIEQEKYIMDQILALPVGQRETNLTTAAEHTKASPLFYWSMLAAAKLDVTRYRKVVEDINTHAPMSLRASKVGSDLGLSQDIILQSVLDEILKYKENGKALYQAGTGPVDGPQGQYFHP